jgi:hypothetical protein
MEGIGITGGIISSFPAFAIGHSLNEGSNEAECWNMANPIGGVCI